MLDILCTYPLSSDLFAQATHPSSPLVAFGLASGHVQLNRLPPSASKESPSQNGYGTVEIAWRTRRHKGSCRSLAFSPDGANIYSAGRDGIVKLASTETGQVTSKIAVPLHKYDPHLSPKTPYIDASNYSQRPDTPTTLHPITLSTLLLSTDSGPLHIYDIRASNDISSKPIKTHTAIHDDYITSIASIPQKSTSSASSTDPIQFLTTGSATVAITDLRKGVLVQSEDQDEELLSSTICAGKAVVGGEKGVLRFWDVGRWDDSEVTVVIGGKGGGADVLTTMPEEEGGGKGSVAVGCEDGMVRFLDVPAGRGRPKVVGNGVVHDEVDGVVGLGCVGEGRLISGGGMVVKIWEEGGEVDEDSVNAEDEGGRDGAQKDSEDGSDSSDDERPRKRRKKRKRGKEIGKGQRDVFAFKDLE
ncbi:uncharacterized protein KY384_001948 [Bacidia gigantensis]|uniref:uncharacterized protein n=1 Tax=Bacidia gigantensis TaxID=2732470 RepID=UPI001D0477CC|nr:uncharacterized protein KY384_001948 [Bacidia gigantensis]KAG8533165.1 hypothetical protein KY384_001948 [Bacidia gigantensis]